VASFVESLSFALVLALACRRSRAGDHRRQSWDASPTLTGAVLPGATVTI